jgi:hypothetical protein
MVTGRTLAVVAAVASIVLAAATCVLPAADKIGGSAGGNPSSGGSSGMTGSTMSSTSTSSSGGCPGPFVATKIATVGSTTPPPTGFATQRRVIYSPRTKRWWLFYVDGDHPSLLYSTSSSDFVTWTSPANVTLPGSIAGGGSPVSVDLFSAAASDIVEIAVTLPCCSMMQNALYLMRGQLTGSTITYGAPNKVCTDKAPTAPYPDVPVIAVSGDAHVAIASGCDPSYHGGAWTVYASSDPDPGTFPWNPTWPTPPFNLYGGPGMNNRALIRYSGTMFMFAGQDEGQVPAQTVDWSTGSAAAGFSSSGQIFSLVDQDVNGWSLFADGTNVHALRFTTNPVGYDHQFFSANAWSSVLGPDKTHVPFTGTGLFAATDGTTPLAFVIDSMTEEVMAAKGVGSPWVWSSVWSAMPSGNMRQYIAGYSEAVNHQVPLIWTEGPSTSSSSYEIWGGLFCSQ